MRLNELDYTIVFLPSLARACSSSLHHQSYFSPTYPAPSIRRLYFSFFSHIPSLRWRELAARALITKATFHSSFFAFHFSLLTLDVGMLSSARVLLRFLYGFHQEYSNPQGIQLRTVVPRESPSIQYICQVLYNNSHH